MHSGSSWKPIKFKVQLEHNKSYRVTVQATSIFIKCVLFAGKWQSRTIFYKGPIQVNNQVDSVC